MSAVQSVTVQLRAPTAQDVGQITHGFFIIDGDTLVMTYPDGEPIDEYQFRVKITPDSDIRAIASVQTKKVRIALAGLTEEQDAFFNRPLNYSSSVA